jgi:hypothetical protein
MSKLRDHLYLSPERVISRDSLIFRKTKDALLEDKLRLRGSHVGDAWLTGFPTCGELILPGNSKIVVINLLLLLLVVVKWDGMVWFEGAKL